MLSFRHSDRYVPDGAYLTKPLCIYFVSKYGGISRLRDADLSIHVSLVNRNQISNGNSLPAGARFGNGHVNVSSEVYNRQYGGRLFSRDRRLIGCTRTIPSDDEYTQFERFRIKPFDNIRTIRERRRPTFSTYTWIDQSCFWKRPNTSCTKRENKKVYSLSLSLFPIVRTGYTIFRKKRTINIPNDNFGIP